MPALKLRAPTEALLKPAKVLQMLYTPNPISLLQPPFGAPNPSLNTRLGLQLGLDFLLFHRSGSHVLHPLPGSLDNLDELEALPLGDGTAIANGNLVADDAEGLRVVDEVFGVCFEFLWSRAES
jgi:hypothetical protein